MSASLQGERAQREKHLFTRLPYEVKGAVPASARADRIDWLFRTRRCAPRAESTAHFLPEPFGL